MKLEIPLLSMIEVRKVARSVAVCCMIGAVLAGCSGASDAPSINDPNEAFNRKVHAFNRAVDEVALRPMAKSTEGNGEVAKRLIDFSANLGKPADIVNNILQLRLVKASENLMRFGMNTIFGAAGFFDVATAAGMPANDTDFGETLHIWGAPEGAYVELPFIGPSTERDLVGLVVGAFIDPVSSLPETERMYLKAMEFAGLVSDRSRYSELTDSVLYESADSYAQVRLLYLQNRRHELGQAESEENFVDPYEDPYAE